MMDSGLRYVHDEKQIKIGASLRTHDARGVKIAPRHEVEIAVGSQSFFCQPDFADEVAKLIQHWAHKVRERNVASAKSRKAMPT